MDSKPATIIIPCYKQAHFLSDAIESALAQTVPCSVYVVDDHSPDNVYEVVRKYKGVGYIWHSENKGLSAARNSGIRQAETEWILPLDADDTIHPTMIEKCLEVNADIVGVGQQTFGDYSQSHIFLKDPVLYDFMQWNQINCCSLFRKGMWEAVGGYDESMREGYEDWDFWLRSVNKGYTVKTIQEVLFFYRKHGNSMVSEAVQKHDKLKQYIIDKLNQ